MSYQTKHSASGNGGRASRRLDQEWRELRKGPAGLARTPYCLQHLLASAGGLSWPRARVSGIAADDRAAIVLAGDGGSYG
jgi:hypothetical protein